MSVIIGKKQDWEVTEAPAAFKAGKPGFMLQEEHRRYATGLVSLYQYQASQFSVTYIQAELTAATRLDFEAHNHAFVLLVVFDGVISCCTGGAEGSSNWGSRTCNLFSAAGQPVGITIAEGKAGVLLFRVHPDYIRPLVEDLEHLSVAWQVQGQPPSFHIFPSIPLNAHAEHTICRELLRSPAGHLSNIRIKHTLYNLLVYYELQLATPESLPADGGRYRDVIELIKAEIASQPNRSTQSDHYFAGKHGIGEVTLNRYFKLVTGYTLSAYRIEQCMYKALELIRQGLGFQEIADMLGYTEQANFSKAFKEYHGFTPRDYKSSLFY